MTTRIHPPTREKSFKTNEGEQKGPIVGGTPLAVGRRCRANGALGAAACNVTLLTAATLLGDDALLLPAIALQDSPPLSQCSCLAPPAPPCAQQRRRARRAAPRGYRPTWWCSSTQTPPRRRHCSALLSTAKIPASSCQMGHLDEPSPPRSRSRAYWARVRDRALRDSRAVTSMMRKAKSPLLSKSRGGATSTYEGTIVSSQR